MHRASILLEPGQRLGCFFSKSFLSPIINPRWSSKIYTMTSIPLLLCYLTSNPSMGHLSLNSKYSPPLVGKLYSALNLTASDVWGNISYHVFNDSSFVDNTSQSWSGWQVPKPRHSGLSQFFNLVPNWTPPLQLQWPCDPVCWMITGIGDYWMGTHGKARDEPISRDHQLALSPFTHIFRSHYDQGTKFRLFDLVEQKEKKHEHFLWFLLNQWISPNFLLCGENRATLGGMWGYLQSDPSPQAQCARQVRRSFSYESSLSANPWEILWRTPINKSLLIFKQVNRSQVPYMKDRTSYTKKKMRGVIHGKFKTITTANSFNFLCKF